MKQLVFVSSVQKELAAERRALKDYIQGDALLGRFFEVFLFEDMPASGRRADEVYLREVDRCGIYLGLLGNDYGYEDAEGVSPTEREFDRATVTGKERLIFVKGDKDSDRHSKMQTFVRKVGNQLIRRRFTETADLIAAVYASLVDYLERTGTIQNRPFDKQPCPDATLDDINSEAVTTFVRRARAERQFPLAVDTSMIDVLSHLDMIVDGRPTRAAILLFGHKPQRFHISAVIKCARFHGIEVAKPIPFYQIFEETLYKQVDNATDFVLSKLDRSVGTRSVSAAAPVKYEIPKDAILEIIVNAVAHRDYTSNSAVQVFVFADRVEVWNPGHLPRSLTPDKLRKPHSSDPPNPLIARPLYLAHYIESLGTGTLDVIQLCRESELPEPDFEQRGNQFVVTLWRDWLTTEVLTKLRLNDRQRQAIKHMKVDGELSNTQYQNLVNVSKGTAYRELTDLVTKGVIERIGTTGKGTGYVLGKGISKGSKGSRRVSAKGTIKGPKGPSPDTMGTPKVAQKDKISRKNSKAKTKAKAQVVSKLGPSRTRAEAQDKAQDKKQIKLSATEMTLLRACQKKACTGYELLQAAGYAKRTGNFKRGMDRLLEAGLLEMMIPDKPNSRLQKYRLTTKGRTRLLRNQSD